MNNDNIQGLKLTNGLDLIGDVQGETEDGRLVIKEAFFLQTVQSAPQGDINVEYLPLTLLGKPTGKNHQAFDVDLPKISILFQFELHPGIVDRYMQLVSPIILPPTA